MVLRRLTGLLTAACMLHLSIVASDAACAVTMHAARGMHEGMPMAPDAPDMHAGLTRHAVGESANGRGCDTPVRPECCRALASCALTFAAAGSASHLAAIERGELPQSVVAKPRSELPAPATPPPKA